MHFSARRIVAILQPSSLVIALVLSLGNLSAHAEVDALVQQAQAATTQGRAQEAYDLLEPQEVTRAGDTDFDLAFGIAANAIGEFSRAIMALERVVAMQPENKQARAELGRCPRTC